ncbi:MAG: hydrogenase nickel incorporation protein HypB [Candidatus Aminicenantes bacterium]|nr:hydrogenase nickel incorporation protein HypB [Candidatus Aminicenantes bacterium]
MKKIKVEKKLLSTNQQIAEENRRLFKEKGVAVFNLLSSPGSGKTSLIERTVSHLQGRLQTAVITGDLQTDRDAQRIARHRVSVKQITTGGACHLDASMVKKALPFFPIDELDLLLIENVGNLVCPAAYDLGEDAKVTIMSVPEGDDKPLKYPVMFRISEVLIINKVDLLSYTNFDMEQAVKFARQINPAIEVFETSCTTGTGLEGWYRWLEERVSRLWGATEK